LMNESEKATLIERCQAGDREAFRELVEQHARVLFGTAYLMTRDRGLAEDTVQSAFIKIWRHIPSLRVNGNLKAWLARVVINEVKQQWRKRRVPTGPLDDVPEAAGDPGEVEAAIIRDEEYRQLREALGMLPLEQREALVLRYYADLTVPEIARVTGQREGTVKSRLSRALGRLGKILRNDEAAGEEVISWKTKE
jgi:RNA polymerase sigma-70 factor (ECF subfamily)